jgi:hypothetical protein
MITNPEEVPRSLGNVYSYKQGYSSWKEFIKERGDEGFKQFLKDLYELKKNRTQSSKCS